MSTRERNYVDLAVFRYRSGYREINALLAVPNAPTPMPAIILAHDIFGLDDHIEDLAIRFAREGYAVLAPDFYTTKGGPGTVNLASLDGQRNLRRSTPDTLAIGDVNNGFNYLKQDGYVDTSRVAVVGFGYGGTVALLAASQNREFAAAVNFFGDIVYPKTMLDRTKPNSPVDMVQYLNCPLLNIYGAPDDAISRQDLSLLERQLRNTNKTFDLKVFPGAPNGFFNDTRPEYYQAQAAREAMTLTLNWLDRVLGK